MVNKTEEEEKVILKKIIPRILSLESQSCIQPLNDDIFRVMNAKWISGKATGIEYHIVSSN